MANKKQRFNISKILALLKVLNDDKRYNPESYSFVMAALNFTVQKLNRNGHVSGEELLEGLREYALEQFGPMARTVLEHWGIKMTDDFGEIIFNMISAGILGRTEKDTKEDFNNRFDFKIAFDNTWKYTFR